MTLNEQAEALKRQFLEQTDPAIAERVGSGLERLVEAHPAGNALGVGEHAPDFALRDVRGGIVKLSEHLARGPVVLSFYRGGWCPFCSLELRAWRHCLDRVHDLGAELIAVSPEAADRARSAVEEQGFDFPVATDADQDVAAAYGLVFELPEPAREAQSLLEAPLDRCNADGTWWLPVPATYVLDTRGTIRWAWAGDDYTRRAEPADAVEALRELVGR